MSFMEVLDLRQARIRLAELDRQRALLARQLSALQTANGGPDIGTAEGRVALFYSLFRGRRDVFATRWDSTKTAGRSGWAPRCRNEWRPGVCVKPKVKCADCANRRFVPLMPRPRSAATWKDGRRSASTRCCRTRRAGWSQSTLTERLGGMMSARCVRAPRRLAIPVLVERSRSGDGAHVWVLFARTCRSSRCAIGRLASADASDVLAVDLDGARTTGCSPTRTRCPPAASAI